MLYYTAMLYVPESEDNFVVIGTDGFKQENQGNYGIWFI
jgi:hypothetical protein